MEFFFLINAAEICRGNILGQKTIFDNKKVILTSLNPIFFFLWGGGGGITERHQLFRSEAYYEITNFMTSYLQE